MKRGQPIPPFTSTLIPADAQARVRWELVSASTPSDVRTVFAAERAREGAPTSLEAPVVALAAPTPAPASPDVVAALSRAVLEHISQATLVELRGMRADVARALSL